MREVTVGSLPPGAAFRVDLGPHGNLDYRLLYANQCRAYVEPLARGTRQVKNADGDVLAEFEDRGGRQNIAPTTMCQRLMDIPIEEIDMTTNRPARKRGDRREDPKVQERPVRANTTRAKMLEMLLADPTGQTNVKAVMAKFEMDRNLVVAHVHEMWRCHGYGYAVVGDTITLSDPLPNDAEDLL